jgi:hypothetical protein
MSSKCNTSKPDQTKPNQTSEEEEEEEGKDIIGVDVTSKPAKQAAAAHKDIIYRYRRSFRVA